MSAITMPQIYSLNQLTMNAVMPEMPLRRCQAALRRQQRPKTGHWSGHEVLTLGGLQRSRFEGQTIA
jgi:hypothetical protein